MILEKVKALCREKGISIFRLEKECGLGNATIAKWDVSMPKADSLKKVADYFNVTVDCLLEDGDEGEEG